MYRALIIKELRESAALFALAGLALVYALAELTATPILPWQSSYLYIYPFISDSLSFYLYLAGGGLAIGLALRQTAWELGQGTFLFLLHRPVGRSGIFACKLLVGLLGVMGFAAMMIALYGWWASVPGQFGAPFFWSMTIPAWIHWIALPPVYFGAFLSGVRPGQWFGSRLVPLMAGIFCTTVASVMPWFWLATAVSTTGSGLLLVGISYHLQTRDY